MGRIKNSMASLDVLSLQRELSVLSGSYVDKAFGGNPFSIRFNTEKGKKELVVSDNQFAFLSDPLEKAEGGEIGSLAAAVRRRLGNSRVESTAQIGFDRLLLFEFSRPEGASLVVELMGKGNLILLDGGRVVAASRFEKRKGHEVFPGSAYQLPALRFDMLRAGSDEFEQAVRKSKGDIVRTLATVIGLGGDLAEEVCTRTRIPFATAPEDLGAKKLGELFETIIMMVREVEEKPEPVLYYEAGTPVQFTPIPFEVFSAMEAKHCGTLSNCVYEFLRNRPEAKSSAEDGRTAKLVSKQNEAIGRFRHEWEVTKAFADAIYTDYDAFHSIVSAMRSGKETAHRYSKNIDGTLTMLVSDVQITISPEDDMHGIASSIYDQAKELERKLKRAEEALAEMSARKAEEPERKAAPELKRRSKKFWFENYRWFVSSEGCLVLAGRDARSNDSLVSKHMLDGDRYAHADVYGAPSVVVKWQERAGERTLEEACAFALCFSRAWHAQIGAASAYWVMPDQVSKTPESGEFLPRGAFVIRGKRNYFSKLGLELAVGVIEYSGERRLVCAPVSAVASRVRSYFRLKPGTRTKENIAGELAPLLGVSRDEVVSALPPGRSACERGA